GDMTLAQSIDWAANNRQQIADEVGRHGAVLFRGFPIDGAKDFDALLAGLDDAKARADDIFRQEVRALEDKDRLMEEKFREAMERIDEVDDGKPPERPWDFD
ncbi:MAG: hypothetical protein AAGE94_18565, partial [Acidobacteriota bacterium]